MSPFVSQAFFRATHNPCAIVTTSKCDEQVPLYVGIRQRLRLSKNVTKAPKKKKKAKIPKNVGFTPIFHFQGVKSRCTVLAIKG